MCVFLDLQLTVLVSALNLVIRLFKIIRGQTSSTASSRELAFAGANEGLGWRPVLLIALLVATLFALRVASPANLRGQDQERPVAYVLDAVHNGNWLCQRDLSGDITSKPPFYTWCCALLTALCGQINIACLYLPGALGALGTACLVFRFARIHFGFRAALFSVLAVLLTTASLKSIGLARTDGVFAFIVTATALLAYRSWIRGGGWTWFWLLGAVATLTKGPLGVVLGAGGLLAFVWERKSLNKLPFKGSHLLGIALFLLITGGWLCLAWWQYGPPVITKLLGKELVAHALGTDQSHIPGTRFWQPPLYYLGRAAPWSLLAYYGLWRLWRHPAAEAGQRRFERFVFCWFAAGLFIFSMSPHQRGDLLWPIMPAGAMIAGRELARLTRAWSSVRIFCLVSAIITLALAGFSVYYFGGKMGEGAVLETVALKKLAHDIEQTGGEEFPLTHVDDSMTLQFYLNTMRPRTSPERAAELLRGAEPAFVAIRNQTKLNAARKPDDLPWFTLLPDPAYSNHCPTRIVGNRPELKAEDVSAFCFGPLFIRARGVKLLGATEREFRFVACKSRGEIVIANESAKACSVRVAVEGGDEAEQIHERTLLENQTWSVAVSSASQRAQ